MEHLIDKDALVAEIERLKNTSLEYGYSTMQKVLADSGKDISLGQLQNFINTIDVKEVNLEKEIKNEIDEYWYDNDYGAIQRHGGTITMEVSDVKEIAKHFFELGLKAQNKITPLQQQRISVMKMEFWTGLQTFNESEMTLSDAYNKGIEDVLEELELKAQKEE